MTGWIRKPCLTTVSALTEVPPCTRVAWRDGSDDPPSFRAAHEAAACLREVEIGPPRPVASAAEGSLRVLCWNVERLRHLSATADLIRTVGADVSLLTEIDKGMARTGNTHRTAELSEALGHPFAYAVEFIELDLGMAAERQDHAGEANALGFHGNALLSRVALQRPVLFRLEAEGAWFGWTRGEPRVGGRIALGGQVLLDGVAVTLVGLHLESHSDPAHRAALMARLLELIAHYDPEAPVLIGGDVNTSTTIWAERLAGEPEDPVRRCDVVDHEPLFAVMAAHGFDWTLCNVPLQPTQRFGIEDRDRARGKIDWIFTRGLAASDAVILPALGPDGTILSDHEALAVTVSLPA